MLSEILVKDASGLTDLKPRAVIGIGGKIYEVAYKGDKYATNILISDEGGNKIELHVREMGKLNGEKK